MKLRDVLIKAHFNFEQERKKKPPQAFENHKRVVSTDVSLLATVEFEREQSGRQQCDSGNMIG